MPRSTVIVDRHGLHGSWRLLQCSGHDARRGGRLQAVFLVLARRQIGPPGANRRQAGYTASPVGAGRARDATTPGGTSMSGGELKMTAKQIPSRLSWGACEGIYEEIDALPAIYRSGAGALLPRGSRRRAGRKLAWLPRSTDPGAGLRAKEWPGQRPAPGSEFAFGPSSDCRNALALCRLGAKHSRGCEGLRRRSVPACSDGRCFRRHDLPGQVNSPGRGSHTETDRRPAILTCGLRRRCRRSARGAGSVSIRSRAPPKPASRGLWPTPKKDPNNWRLALRIVNRDRRPSKGPR